MGVLSRYVALNVNLNFLNLNLLAASKQNFLNLNLLAALNFLNLNLLAALNSSFKTKKSHEVEQKNHTRCIRSDQNRGGEGGVRRG
jgi:hypothetical protein